MLAINSYKPKTIHKEGGGRNAALFLFQKETAPRVEGLLYGSDASLLSTIRVKVMYTGHSVFTKKFMKVTLNHY
jgi:hypothetical protein